jgi:hypothetical protein
LEGLSAKLMEIWLAAAQNDPFTSLSKRG